MTCIIRKSGLYLGMLNKEKKPTYTLWNGVQLIKTYPHTREGMDAAMERAMELGLGAKLYSSRDDLVWSARMADELMDCE